jgi:predicted transcriptional regulator
MATKKEETASFVLRFTQKIFKNDENEPQVQWRGTIRHVQSGDETRFSKYEDASDFVQSKLAELTMQAVEDKSPEEQKGILSKSFDLWKKMAVNTPKLVIESIKDPKKQVAHIQEQLQEQLHNVTDAIGHKIEDKLGQKLEIDDWRSSSKSDFKNIMKLLEKMSGDIETLNKKVNNLTKKANKKSDKS